MCNTTFQIFPQPRFKAWINHLKKFKCTLPALKLQAQFRNSNNFNKPLPQGRSKPQLKNLVKTISIKTLKLQHCELKISKANATFFGFKFCRELTKMLQFNPRKVLQSFSWFPIKHGCTLTGFKKLLFNRVSANNGVLVPAYNRRKYARSHNLLIQNQCRKLSKTFGYVNVKTTNFWLAQVLASTYIKQTKPRNQNQFLQFAQYQGFKSETKPVVLNSKPLNKFISAIETQGWTLLCNCEMYKTFYHAKQFLTHQSGCKSQVKPVLAKWLNFKYSTGVDRSCGAPYRTIIKNLNSMDLNYIILKTYRWVDRGGVLRSF